MTQPLSESLEDYLEAIFQVEAVKKAARAKDIVGRLGVSNASVTGALRSLAAKKLVNYAPYDLITLTSKGKEYAERIIFRHNVLKSLLVDVLEVEEKTADEAACRMEHAISCDVQERLAHLLKFLEEKDLISEFHKSLASRP
jgi:DtxR family Mn-dependent transcriptional regulator